MMDKRRRAMRSRTRAAVACGALLFTWVAVGQNIDSSQMTSIFNGLSSDEQQAIMQQLGGAGGGSTSNTTTGTGTTTRPRTGNTDNTTNGQQRQRQRTDGNEADTLPSALQPLRPPAASSVMVCGAGDALGTSRTPSEK